ncbi:MAG: polyisoprenoid-binding protein [Flavobacteriales bacterium CG_4_9_14_3_um_filter_40_17]|nr:MAG: polyisoprenoid-binding protein [Flavobacteriales bacterium CG_4_9_14_3_um_filter_40_17]
MKHVTFSIVSLLVCSFSATAQWEMDKGHSKATFIAVHHLISDVDGYFKSIDAKITASSDDLSDAVFEFTAQTASIFTDLEMRDKDLKSEGMFDVEKFPTLSFKSTKLTKISSNKYKLDGDITIKGITKPVTFDLVMNGPVVSPNPNNKKLQLGLKATGTVNRSDFGVGGKLASAMVSDEIQLRFTGEFHN